MGEATNEDVLTGADPVTELMAQFTPEESAIAARLLPIIAAQANRQAEANKAKQLELFMDELQAENKKIIEVKIEEYRKMMTPPSASELQVLLDKEYLHYTVQIAARGGPRSFTVQELPMRAEAKLLGTLKTTLSTRLKELSSIEWTATMTMAERILRLMEIIPGVLETLAGCIAICLDPWGEDTTMNAQWVMDNLSAVRIAAILHAQIEVSRMRDFLSLASRFSPSLTMI